jgi:hypothetical protein
MLPKVSCPRVTLFPGKPGLVESPFSPGKYINVEGFPPGTEVKDPYTAKIFRVPQPRLDGAITTSQHVYEVRPRKDHHGVDLISDALPFGRLWYGEPDAVSNAIDYAKFRSRSH